LKKGRPAYPRKGGKGVKKKKGSTRLSYSMRKVGKKKEKKKTPVQP